jgi:hypothetical protein
MSEQTVEEVTRRDGKEMGHQIIGIRLVRRKEESAILESLFNACCIGDMTRGDTGVNLFNPICRLR